MLLDLDDIRKWRQRQPIDSLELFAIGMLKTLRTELSDGKTAPRLLGIDEKRAAALLLAAFDKGHFEVTGHGSDSATNQAIAQLRRIATA
jgi:hypothetical protein